MLLNPLSVWCSEKEKRFLGATLGFLDWAPTADFFRVCCGHHKIDIPKPLQQQQQPKMPLNNATTDQTETLGMPNFRSVLVGGLHQIQAPDPEVERIARMLHDQYRVDRIAPGHCTGEPEFAALKRAFGDHYVYAGVGSVVDLPK